MTASVRFSLPLALFLLAAGCTIDDDAGGRSAAGKADESQESLCCDPAAEPGTGDNPFCFEGATCCADGTWQCNEGAGESTCAAPGDVCEEAEPCCDPAAEPGTGDNPFCFEGATCCADGTWQCNEGAGESTCAAPGQVCEPAACCDPAAEPGTGDNAFCFEGATCCADGTWQCNEGAGESTCAAPGDVCEPASYGG